MVNRLASLSKKILSHRYGLTLFAFITAGIFTGISCVMFMQGFEFVLSKRLDFQSIGFWTWFTTPLLFIISVQMVRTVAPCAAGTGIPQAIFAARHLTEGVKEDLWPLISPLTLIIKITALLIAVLGCASTGREGPTVHVATCIFVGLMMIFSRLTRLKFDLRSIVVAGGAAGLAAAFNTPLAGVTFAIEELTVDYFASIKDFVIIAIIIASIAAKSVTGEYTYFGKLLRPDDIPLTTILIIGVLGGILGAAFSSAILWGQEKLKTAWQGISGFLVPIVLSLALLVVGLFSVSDIFGPGNQMAQSLLVGNVANLDILFPIKKILSTLFTYWSGIAGGIFAPCLSVGAAMGADVGQWTGISVSSCALIGMAAFLSGTIQAPITSFVIIFEMTGHHNMLLPIMLSSILAFMIARLIGAKHLYNELSLNYQYLLEPRAEPSSDKQIQ